MIGGAGARCPPSVGQAMLGGSSRLPVGTLSSISPAPLMGLLVARSRAATAAIRLGCSWRRDLRASPPSPLSAWNLDAFRTRPKRSGGRLYSRVVIGAIAARLGLFIMRRSHDRNQAKLDGATIAEGITDPARSLVQTSREGRRTRCWRAGHDQASCARGKKPMFGPDRNRQVLVMRRHRSSRRASRAQRIR